VGKHVIINKTEKELRAEKTYFVDRESIPNEGLEMGDTLTIDGKVRNKMNSKKIMSLGYTPAGSTVYVVNAGDKAVPDWFAAIAPIVSNSGGARYGYVVLDSGFENDLLRTRYL